MKKVQLNLNKIILLFLFVFSLNNSIFAQEKEAIETSKKLYKYMMEKKEKNKHTLKISYKIYVYVEKYGLHNISNSILARLGYFDGNDLALTEFIKEIQIPKIKEEFNKNNINYDDIVILYNEDKVSDKSIDFKVSFLFDLVDECYIDYEYTNFNSEVTDSIKETIVSDASVKVKKLHNIIGLENTDIVIDDTKCKWEIVSDKTK